MDQPEINPFLHMFIELDQVYQIEYVGRVCFVAEALWQNHSVTMTFASPEDMNEWLVGHVSGISDTFSENNPDDPYLFSP